MSAGVQEHMHRPPGVAAQDDRPVTHPRDEEVAGTGDLALMADEQPGAGEQFLEFLAVEFGRDEDLAADRAVFRIDHLVDGQCCCHSALPPCCLSPVAAAPLTPVASAPLPPVAAAPLPPVAYAPAQRRRVILLTRVDPGAVAAGE